MVKAIEWVKGNVKLLDQLLLPAQKKMINCRTYKETGAAIKKMQVRGAPAIGVAAAFGMAQAAMASKAKTVEDLTQDLKKAADFLKSQRPTAVNLAWAVDRMMHSWKEIKNFRFVRVREKMVQAAQQIMTEDMRCNQSIATHGEELLREGDRVLTHCNTGALATAGVGTALGIITQATQSGKKLKIWVDETRPFLQGARLTAWELKQAGIEHQLITDSTAGFLMSRGMVDVVIVGADRITAQGDVANKIGTYSLAVLAYENKVPFYVAAPVSTVDLAMENGDEIPIEERSAKEVLEVLGKKIAPAGTDALHYAFDVTPHRLISAIVTEAGVVRAPYKGNLKQIVEMSDRQRDIVS